MDSRAVHCRPITRVPAQAQTSLQVKLDAVLNMMDSALSLMTLTSNFLTDTLGNITGELGVIVGAVTNVIDGLSEAVRRSAWKVPPI